MLIVMIVILTSTAFAAVHQRQLGAALRIEQARVLSEEFNLGPVSVLGIAIDLLDTGDAPAPISYSYDHTVGGVTTTYRVSYARSGNQWTVTADPDASGAVLPTLPTSF